MSSLGLSSSVSLLFSTDMALSRSLPCATIFFSLSFSCFSCFCLSLFSLSRSWYSSSSRKRWRFWNSALISRSSSSNLFWKRREGLLGIKSLHWILKYCMRISGPIYVGYFKQVEAVWWHELNSVERLKRHGFLNIWKQPRRNFDHSMNPCIHSDFMWLLPAYIFFREIVLLADVVWICLSFLHIYNHQIQCTFFCNYSFKYFTV